MNAYESIHQYGNPIIQILVTLMWIGARLIQYLKGILGHFIEVQRPSKRGTVFQPTDGEGQVRIMMLFRPRCDFNMEW